MDITGLLKSALELASKWSGYFIGKKEREIKDHENPEKELERRKEQISQEITTGDEVLTNTGVADDLERMRNLSLRGDRVGQGNQESQKR